MFDGVRISENRLILVPSSARNGPNAFFTGGLQAATSVARRPESLWACKWGFRGEILLIIQRPKLNRECLSSIPPKAATQSCYSPRFTTCAPEARKSGLFRAFVLVSKLRFLLLGAEVAESLRPIPEKFPFCGDYWRRPVRSRLPPDHGTLPRASWSLSATSSRPKPKNATTPCWNNPPWRHKLNQMASSNPGAVQIIQSRHAAKSTLPMGSQ